MKANAFRRIANIEAQPADAKRAERLLSKYDIQVRGTVHIHAQTMNINSQKGARENYVLPEDVIGGSSAHLRYASHLIERYNDFGSKQEGREHKYAAVYKTIERKFGTKWKCIPLERFDEFTSFMQQRIDATKLGKINKSKGYPNYSPFEQYDERVRHG